MATTAEWKTSVENAIPTLKEELRNGTKTQEEYNTAITALITEGSAVTDSDPELNNLTMVKLITAKSFLKL